jgi:type II secretory pathway pseudopilin PulG
MIMWFCSTATREIGDAAANCPIDRRERIAAYRCSRSFGIVRLRRAVTLIEVIFAIGVILIGMVGLLAVLPLAGSRARSSVALNTGTAIADSAFDQLIAGGFLNTGRLFRADGTALAFNESICIDPVQVITLRSTTVSGNGYSKTVFPHYLPNHNPLLDPSLTGGGSVNWTTDQPRLVRVGMQHDGGRPFSLEEALKVTESQDDIPAERPKDRTQNTYVRGYPGISGGLSYGKRLATGEYSWIATLDPHSTRPQERFGLLSVVVFRTRDRGFIFPSAAAATPQGNANRERLALVTAAQGFQGGAGGVVTLVSSANTTSNLTANHWIMLSRTIPTVGAIPTHPVHRWYRVAGTDGDPVETTAGELGLTQAAAGTEVWRRRVLLDGSDWAFDAANPTFATIADSVISVTERLVRIR